jgi:hypothetical protein
MTSTAHLSWERLNAWADTGPACRAAIERLRALSASARALPEELDAPDGLWVDIAASIAAGGSRTGPAPSVPASSVAGPSTPALQLSRGDARGAERRPDGDSARSRWLAPRALAAAAVVLIAVSSGVTALLLRGGGGGADVALRRSAGVTPGGSRVLTVALSPSFVATEAAYLENVGQLQALLATQRDALSPRTIAVLEHSLASIDLAIAEARTALVQDPANQALAELLSVSYRQKVELLRRAAEFPHSL